MSGSPSPVRRPTLPLVALLTAATLCAQGAEEAQVWFDTPALHAVHQDLEAGELETPQATLEQFVVAGRRSQWRRCARALDLRLVEVDVAGAAELARELYYVLNQEIWIDWDTVPDRADGMREPGALAGSSPLAGAARRGLRIGSVEVDGILVPINLHRVKAPDRAPVWLFSAHTVDNVGRLYEAHGPSALAERMPAWARKRGPWQLFVWQWIGLAIALLVAPTLGFVVGGRVVRRLARFAPERVKEQSLKLRWPISALVAATVVWAIVDGVLGLPSVLASFLEPMTLIAMVAAFVWLLMRIITVLIDRVLERSVADGTEDDDARRRLLTQVKVARHVILFALALIGVAIVLLQLNTFRAVGLTLLSSAGAMAVILGIAGHTVLGNLVAGVHIALAQPFRIGDVVLVEGRWGRIEDVSYVDVVVRTWDERRLVFPIRYFVDNWFENWSKTDEFLLQTIRLPVDYSADVGRIREKFAELVRADEDFDDQKDPEVLVSDLGDETMSLRMTCGGADSAAAWRLVNRVREGLIAWLQSVEDGAWLPRRRVDLAGLTLPAEGDDEDDDYDDDEDAASPR